MKKNGHIWVILLILCIAIFTVVMLVTPTVSRFNSSTSYDLWYVDTESPDQLFGHEHYSFKGIYKSDPALYHSILTTLIDQPRDTSLKSAFAPNTRIRGVELRGNTVGINFSAEFGAMSGYDISLAKYCIAKTFSVFESVSEIAIFVEGIPLNSPGSSNYSINDYITAYSDMHPHTVDTILYTLSDTGTHLVSNVKSFTHYPHKSFPELVTRELLNCLAEGAIPAGTKLTSIHQIDSTVFIEFSPEFGSFSERKGQLAVYSVVNTVASIPGITNVVISLDGEMSAIAGIPLDTPLSPDLSYVYNK